MKKYKNTYEVSFTKEDPGSFSEGKKRFPNHEIVGPIEDYKSIPEEGIYYAFLGHSSILLEYNGKVILIDPVFSLCVGPTEWLGERRFKGVKPSEKDFGDIDVILISHNHFDHMDLPTLKKLSYKTKTFVVPEGNKKILVSRGIDEKKVFELSWWESLEISDIKITCTPAHHNSTRYLLDKDQTLWCSYVIEGENGRIFYSGDTAYSPHFEDIHSSFKEFDLIFIECGQYNSRWHSSHMFPDESIEACKLLNGKLSIPIHWGAYSLSLHSWDEPIIRFEDLAKKKGIRYKIPVIHKIEQYK